MFRRTDLHPHLGRAFAPRAILAAIGLALAGCASPSYEELIKQAEAIKPPETRYCRVALWVDRKGRVTQAQVVQTSGDADFDKIVEGKVMQLKIDPPPPPETPMPLFLNIGGQRPAPPADLNPS